MAQAGRRHQTTVDVSDAPRLIVETLWLKPAGGDQQQTDGPQRSSFPGRMKVQKSIVHPPNAHTPAGWKKVVSRGREPEQVTFYAETTRWQNPFRIRAGESALAALPAD